MNEFPSVICPHCNAKQLGPSGDCWLCHKSLQESPCSAPEANALPSSQSESISFSLATLFLLITLASVCMGLLVALPGLGVLACIIMVPVFFRTVRVVRHREAMGKDVSPSKKIALFATSFAVSSVLVIVVCVSAFCSFCGVCLTMIGGSSGDEGALAWGVGLCVIAVLGIVAVVKMIQWSRRRYRRDMGED